MYRFGPHTTADDPSVYWDEEELECWKQMDPIPRFGTFLRNWGLTDNELKAEIQTDIKDTVATAITMPNRSSRIPILWSRTPMQIRHHRLRNNGSNRGL